MVDVLYARGWDDCLGAVLTILERSRDVSEAMRKVSECMFWLSRRSLSSQKA